jgi:hypothetical protein
MVASNQEAGGSGHLDPTALSVEDLARVLTAAGWKPINVEMIRADLDDGAPQNADGTINVVRFAAWHVREMGRAD